MADLANETVDSYFETNVFSNAVKVSIEPIFVGSFKAFIKSGILTTAIIVIIALMLCVMYLLIKDIFKGDKAKLKLNE